MGKSLAEIVGEIVLAQCERRDLDAAEIAKISIETAKTFKLIQQMDKSEGVKGEGLLSSLEQPPVAAQQKASTEEEAPPWEVPDTRPKMDWKDSILEDKITCLECGEEFHQLSYKHLAQHGLTVETYKQKYGIPKRQSLVCGAYSKKRSDNVKRLGIAEAMKAGRAKKKALPEAAEQVPMSGEVEAVSTSEEISKKEGTAVTKKEKSASKKEEATS